MKLHTVILGMLLLLCAAGLAADKTPVTGAGSGMSDEMRAIVASLKGGDGHDLNVEKLPGMSREAAAAFDGKKMEKHDIPPPPGTADMFAYTIFFDKAQGKYWVSRTGGFAGVHELFGPADAPIAAK